MTKIILVLIACLMVAALSFYLQSLPEAPWKIYRNEEIGYSVSYPDAHYNNHWEIKLPKDPFVWEEGTLVFKVYQDGLTHISFYKDPSQKFLERLMKNEDMVSEKRVINGQSFTVFSRKIDKKIGVFAGQELISEDQKLLISVLNDTGDTAEVTYKFRDKVIMRILNSLTPI